MRLGRILLVLALLVVGAVAFTALASPVQAKVDPAALDRAEDAGWRRQGAAETSRLGPLDLVRVSTATFERPGPGGVLLGKFYVVSVKSPVPLPSSVVASITDDYIRSLATENGIQLSGARSSASGGMTTLEYAGKTTSGSVFGNQDLGILARFASCDVRGNLVMGVGFASASTSSTVLGGTQESVYVREVKGILSPAVACP